MNNPDGSLLKRLEPHLRTLSELIPQRFCWEGDTKFWTVHALGVPTVLRGGPQDALRLRTACVVVGAEYGLQLDTNLEIGELLRLLALRLRGQLARSRDAGFEDGPELLVTFTARVRANSDASAINRALAALGLEPGVSELTNADICIEDCDEDGQTRSISARHYDPEEIAVLLTALPYTG